MGIQNCLVANILQNNVTQVLNDTRWVNESSPTINKNSVIIYSPFCHHFTKQFWFPLTSTVLFCLFNGSQWEPKLLGYQHFLKYLCLCSSKCLLNILKNVGNQTVLVPTGFHYMDIKYNGSQWEPKLLGYQHSSKYLLLSSSKCLPNILKNAGNQTVSVPIDFHYMDKNYYGCEWEPTFFKISFVFI